MTKCNLVLCLEEPHLTLFLFLGECRKTTLIGIGSFLSVVDLEKAFDRVPRKEIEYALRKKLVQAVMSLYKSKNAMFSLEVDTRKNFMLV